MEGRPARGEDRSWDMDMPPEPEAQDFGEAELTAGVFEEPKSSSRRAKGRRRPVRKWKIALCIIAAALAVYVLYVFQIRGWREPRTRRTETNREAAVYRSEKTMKQMMSIGFPSLASRIKRTYVVPGMKATKTLLGEFRASTMCTSMTPQGMCVTEDYLFISAYCHTMKHSSVFYMMAREDGRLIKTIPLGMLAHVGGMAYDPENRIVWVSGGTLGAAKAVGYRLEDLEAYEEDSRAPAAAVYNYTLATMTKNSYMSYWENMLVIGIFSLRGLSEVSWFDLTEEGGLYSQIFEDYDPVHESVAADYTAVTSGEIQGVSIAGRHLFFSKSYGPLDSVFQIFEYEPFGERFLDEDAVKELRFPQKLEQIYVADGELYCLFESQAYAYRAQPLLAVDRVLVFDIDDILPEEMRTS